VLYGVAKTRYVHPIAFVPLLCFAVGVVELVPRTAARLARLPALASIPVVLAAIGGFFAFGRWAILALTEHVGDLVPLAAFLLAMLGTLALTQTLLPRRHSRPPPPLAAASLLALLVALPLVLGGAVRTGQLLSDIRDFDRAAAAAAEWVEKELPPGERVAALHYSQI
jgi:hypothetical protein